MRKQRIRLTENDLHRIIRESTRRILKENSNVQSWEDFLSEEILTLLDQEQMSIENILHYMSSSEKLMMLVDFVGGAEEFYDAYGCYPSKSSYDKRFGLR